MSSCIHILPLKRELVTFYPSEMCLSSLPSPAGQHTSYLVSQKFSSGKLRAIITLLTIVGQETVFSDQKKTTTPHWFLPCIKTTTKFWRIFFK